MFKECLNNDIVPFIITDELKDLVPPGGDSLHPTVYPLLEAYVIFKFFSHRFSDLTIPALSNASFSLAARM